MGTCAKQLRPLLVTQQRDTRVVSRANRGERRSDPGCGHRCKMRLACDRRQTRLRPPIRQQPARRPGDLAVRSLATPHQSASDRRVNHTPLGSLIVLSWHADAPSALVALHSSKTIYCAQFHEKCHGRHASTELLSRRIIWRDYIRFLLLETIAMRPLVIKP